GEILRLTHVLPHAIYALLHFAHAGEIFVQLRLVAGGDLTLETGRVIHHAVEHANIAQTSAVFKKVVPGERRVHLVRHRRVRTLPGYVRAVRHREIRLVVPGHGLLTGEHDTRLWRVLSDPV